MRDSDADSPDDATAFDASASGIVWVTDLGPLAGWLIAQLDRDPGLTYIEGWKEPYADEDSDGDDEDSEGEDGDGETGGADVIAGDVCVTPLDDPRRVLELAMRFAISSLPGVEAEDEQGEATEIPSSSSYTPKEHDYSTAFNASASGTAWVTDLDALTGWLLPQIERDPVLTYLDDWKEPYTEDYDDEEVAGIEVIAGDVAVTPLNDPGQVLELALRFVISSLPGVEVEDEEGEATEKPSSSA